MPATAHELYAYLKTIPILDTFTRIRVDHPFARTPFDILGHPMITSLCHAAGMDPDAIKYTVPDRERTRAVLSFLPELDNTRIFQLVLEIAQRFWKIDPGQLLHGNVDDLYDQVEILSEQPNRLGDLLKQSNIHRIIVAIDFDHEIENDLSYARYSMQLDDLIDWDAKQTRDRFVAATDIQVTNASSFKLALFKLFDRLTRHHGASVHLRIPPNLLLERVSDNRIDTLIAKANRGDRFNLLERNQLATFMLFKVCASCQENQLPLQLLMGTLRDVYDHGVPGGGDLWDQRFSMMNLHEMFNAFPRVTFLVSPINSNQNGELVSFASIYHNVIASGHWWFSNIPVLVHKDLRARIQAIPRNKIHPFFSSASHLEWILPSFSQYHQVLVDVLSDEFIATRGWSIDKTLEWSRKVLYEQPKSLFNL